MLKYLEVICPKCNGINLVRQDHINNYRCKNCFRIEVEKLTANFNVIKGYTKATEKMELECKKCNVVWKVLLGNLKRNNTCPNCNRLNKDYFEKNKLAEFEYSEFKHFQEKMLIICKKCNTSFYQTPYNNLIRKNGCPNCKSSKGERVIKNYLERNNIVYIQHKTFDGLKDKKNLSYDFYVEEKNLLIEFNGLQHYDKNSFSKSRKEFLLQKHHDWLKRRYAIKNNYNLLVIPYWDFKQIEKILKNALLNK